MLDVTGKRAITNMRKLKEVNQFIYISSNLRPPVNNFLDFASMDSKLGFEGLDPFIVKQVIPLDLAPHSLRCDLVILCERLNVEKIPKSSRPTPKAAKKTFKNNSSQQKKTSQNSAAAGRSSYFPTEEMVRRYSNLRKPRQEIDYKKRDSLYPLPLRGALYQGFEDERSSYYPNNNYEQYYCGPSRTYDGRHLDRYSDFRRDMEYALDETPYYSPGTIDF